MAQAFVEMGAPLSHTEEQRALGSKYVPDLPGTSYWMSGRVLFIDPSQSMSTPGSPDYTPGMSEAQLFIRVDAADSTATLASRVRTEVNALASARSITVPANQILITTYSRI